jgi:cysteine desulfurase
VAGAAGFAAAVESAGDRRANLARAAALNRGLRERLGAMEGVAVNSPGDASPYILNISLEGCGSEAALHFLEGRGIYVSGGSACGGGKRSHTLEAMGLPDAVIESALRISFSDDSSKADVDGLCDGLSAALAGLARV